MIVTIKTAFAMDEPIPAATARHSASISPHHPAINTVIARAAAFAFRLLDVPVWLVRQNSARLAFAAAGVVAHVFRRSNQSQNPSVRGMYCNIRNAIYFVNYFLR